MRNSLQNAQKRKPSWAFLFALLLAIPLRAAGPKISGTTEIYDDFLNGSAGSVGMQSGTTELDGTLGGLGTIDMASGTDEMDGGYFSRVATAPVSAQADDVFSTSGTFSWQNPIPNNPTGTRYRLQVSTASDFSGTITSSATHGFGVTLTGLLVDTTYYARVGSFYTGWLDTLPTAIGSTVTIVETPGDGVFADFGPYSLKLDFTGRTNLGGEDVSFWTGATALPESRYAHGMVDVNGRVYISGGILTGGIVSSATWSAAKLSNGSLGSWVQGSYMPAPRESHSMVAWGGRLYVVGGFDGAAKATVFWAPIEEDGTVGDWETTEALPAARFKHTTAVHGGYLYVFGGDNGIFPQSTVYSAQITDNGPIGAWGIQTALPASRNGHAVSISSGRAYITGGVGAGLETTVYRADLSAGSVGNWFTETALPLGLFRHTSVASRDRLYVMGGFDGSVARAEVYVATVSADGTVGVWNTATNLGSARFMHGIAFDGNRIYAVGGNSGSVGITSGEVGSLTGTNYLSEAATDASFTTIVASSAWQYGTTFKFTTLTPNTTYYVRARARGLSGRETQPFVMQPFPTLPARPASAASTVTLVEVGSFTVAYLDGNNPGGTEYKVEISTSSDFWGDVLSNGFGTALSTEVAAAKANTEYFIRVKSRGGSGRESPYRTLGSTRTLPVIPADVVFSNVQTTGFTLSWSSVTNSLDTVYETQVSSESDFASIAASSSTVELSAVFSGLISASTFYARVRALGVGSIATQYTATVSTETGLDVVDPGRPYGGVAYQSPTADALSLYWVVPGDDDTLGDLPLGSKFYVQWSTENPAGVSWSTAAAQVTIATGPVVRATTVEFELTGLTASSDTAIRVWAQDEAGNYSAPSDTFTAFSSPFAFARVSAGGVVVGTETALSIDGQDRLVLHYSNASSGQTLLRTRTAGTWSAAENVDAIGTGRFVGVALDAGDGVHTVEQGSVRYSSRTSAGSWLSSVPDAAGEGHASIVVGGGGLAQIAYNQGSAGAHTLQHGRYEPGGWVLSPIDTSAATVGRYPSLALSGSGNARVSYSDSAAGTLKYAEWDGSTWLRFVAAAAGTGDIRSALALDGDEGNHIAYRNNGTGDVHLASAPVPGTWANTVVDTGDMDLPAIALDGLGHEHIAYVDMTRGDLKYASYDGISWSTQTVDSLGTVFGQPEIVVSGTGEIVISYRGAQGELKTASWAAGVSGAIGGNSFGRARAPRNFGGNVISSVSVQWTWLDNSANEIGYELYGSLVSTGPYTLIAGTDTIASVSGKGTLASFVESGLTEGGTFFRYVAAVNAGGVSVSSLAAVSPFSTTDITPPTITVNQTGDLKWRRSNDGIYDVDFVDIGGAGLDQVEVKASTVPGGAGPDLIGFTDALVGISSDTFTTDWSIPTAVYDAMLDGATNYVTIRAFDTLLNATTTVDAFFVLKDTSAPTFADNQAGDDTIRAASGTVYDVDALDPASGLVSVQYSVSLNIGSGDASLVGWTDIAVLTSSASYLVDWEVLFGSLVSGSTNYVSMRAWDLAGSTGTSNDVFYILKDVDGSLVSIAAPGSSHHSALATISGTASDVSGLTGVEVAIQTGAPTGFYWSGAAFDQPTRTWLPVTGTDTWSLSPGIAWTDGGSYEVTARSSDTLGNFSTTYATAAFVFDASSPTAGVVFPADGSTINSLPWISGTAGDGAGSGVGTSQIRLRRISDGQYWNFFGDFWSATEVSTSIAGSTSWAVYPSELLKANLASQASYYAEVRAVDTAVPALTGEFSAASSTFTFSDPNPPAAITNLSSIATLFPGEIDLVWTAPGDDGNSGLIRLGEYRIQYTTQTGVSFTTSSAQVSISTSLVNPGSTELHTLKNLIPGATYLLYIWTEDGEGNWSPLSNGATITAEPVPFSEVKGHVMKVSSEGITAVLMEAYDESGTFLSSAFTLADGSGTYTLNNIPNGNHKIIASWTADGITSSVWIDGILSGTVGVDFFLELSYTLSTLTGTLGSVAAGGSAPQGFMVAAEQEQFKQTTIELFQNNRQVVTSGVNKVGRWTISNLLPGKYQVRAFNGFEYTQLKDVDLLEGETKDVSFVFDPLPEADVFAFPNPARSQTTIRFTTTLPGLEAQVRIFDLSGTLVRELTGSEMTSPKPSLYHAKWDLKNMHGESAASGIYLFIVKVKGSNGQSGKVIKKLAVVK